MRMHNPSLPFQCEQCTRVFFDTEEELERHQKMKHFTLTVLVRV